MLEDKINKLQDLIDVQATPGNWDYDPYMNGLLNGMLIAQSVLKDVEPNFPDSPKEWEINTNRHPDFKKDF